MAGQTEFTNAPGVLIVADDAAATAAAIRAVEFARARVVATVPWDRAMERLADWPVGTVLVIETAAVADDRIAMELPALASATRTERCVVAFAESQLDAVAGALIGSDAILLCDPSLAERIAALALAMTGRPPDVRQDNDEAARLLRINQEVTRFVETLGRLTGTAPDPDGPGDRAPIVGDRRGGFGHQPAETAVTAAELRRAIRARRLRDEIFGVPGLFENPAWDMLLDLFAAELERRQVSVSSLCIAAAVAPTTALRWISKLIEIGLFERRPDEFDRRRAFVALTAQASAKMHDYVAAARRNGVAIA